MRVIYLIGSLRNPEIPKIAAALRNAGHEVFDDWHAAGPHADDEWQKYEQGRGFDMGEALAGYAAKHTFEYDKHHLNRCDTVILVMPAGKSAHTELGYAIGKSKRSFVLFSEGYPERWDVMYGLADYVTDELNDLLEVL